MSTMISVASGFQYSVNIGYDLGNDDKLKNFIPTKSALNLLEEILLSVNPNSTDRARVLIGAYGKGKSHIVLAILAILLKRDWALFEKLIPKLTENPRLNQLILNYYSGDNKILPVVINGSNISLAQAFLLALQRTLSEQELLSAMPETNYKAAVGVITRWKKDFPETYAKFKLSLDKPVEKFIERLNNFDIGAYDFFEKIYPALTAGSVFNPFLGFDVAEIYESVAKSLRAKGYSGIYVVYDEFSKFLEANIADASFSDTKMLQDFAEKCCRSGEMQLHLLLISHKEISNYIDRLPKEKTDGWRGVSERFKHIHLNNNFAQIYEIISSVIQHREPLWEEFCGDHVKDFAALSARYQNHQIFLDAQEEIETAIKGCFPLHPVSTFILPRLSEKVAQNERTLFTFLSAEGNATFSAFLDGYENNFALVTPDLIYDYFEPLFQKEIYAGEIHEVFLLTSTILNQVPAESLGSKIIKTISLIYILEQFERLQPTVEQIIGIYSGTYAVSEIEQAISDLIKNELVIYLKQSNDYLRLKKNSGVDIQQKISDFMETQAGKITAKEILNAANFDNYIYPSRYNAEHEMTRFFAFQFISGAEITADVDWDAKSAALDADGIIYGVIPDDAAQLENVRQILMSASKDYKRYIFVLPKHFKDFSKIILEYAAVKNLRDSAADDLILFDEYEIIFEDLQEIIKNLIASYTRPESFRSIYIHAGEILNVQRKSALTEKMSKICDKIFSETPVINNESVNKNELTNIAQNSRNKIVSALLRSELEPNLGFSGASQEISIMRSTLIKTGILIDNAGIPKINLRPKNPQMQNMLGTIENFILEARQGGQINFSVLYERLTKPDYHIGLRRGLIPIYLAAVLHNYRQQTVIFERTEPVKTSADILAQINSEPSKFALEYLNWNLEKENYVAQLAEIFSEYVIDAEKSGNAYDYVANAVYRWYRNLPKFSKESTRHPSGDNLSRQQLEFLKLLRQNTSSADLLFKKIPAAFNCREDYAKVAETVAETKNIFDNLLKELNLKLIDETKIALGGEKISLSDAVKDWCGQLEPKVFEQLFSDGTDKFLRQLETAPNDEKFFIENLAKLMTGLRIEDWDAKTSAKYFEMLNRFMQTAKNFQISAVAETVNKTSSYQVTFSDETGENMTRRFDRVEISARGKLLFNQITAALDAMGQAISAQEKRQIVIEILKKIC